MVQSSWWTRAECDTFKNFKPGILGLNSGTSRITLKNWNTHRLWLEKHVRGDNHFWPDRPSSKIILELMAFDFLTPANTNQIKKCKFSMSENHVLLFWRDVESKRVGNSWTAKLPVMNVDDYVFSYANIR